MVVELSTYGWRIGCLEEETSGVFAGGYHLSYQADDLHNSNDQRPEPLWVLAASFRIVVQETRRPPLGRMS